MQVGVQVAWGSRTAHLNELSPTLYEFVPGDLFISSEYYLAATNTIDMHCDTVIGYQWALPFSRV